MGRKAKLKQQKKEILNQSEYNSEANLKSDPTHFVEQIQRQGYSLKHNQFNFPEMPDQDIKPQI